jgi:hypothetical protein
MNSNYFKKDRLMSVDLITGVMNAADNHKLAVACRKLAHLKAQTPAEKGLFQVFLGKMQAKSSWSNVPRTTDLIERVMAAADPEKQQFASAALDVSTGTLDKALKPTSKRDPMIALEGAMMSKLVDQMMPKGDDSIYGNGLAGDTWRGFAVNQMSETVAAADPLRLAESSDDTDLGSPVNLYNTTSEPPYRVKHIRPFVT